MAVAHPQNAPNAPARTTRGGSNQGRSAGARANQDWRQLGWPTQLASWAGLLALGCASLLALLQPLPRPAPGAGPALGRPCTMDRDGFLRGSVYGAISMHFDWSGSGLTCDGMLRPAAGGIRLFFAKDLGRRGAPGRILVVLGIDGLPAELVGQERAANVTVIDERNGRFFGTRGAGRCWTTVQSARRLAMLGPDQYRIDGRLYCSGTLPSLRDLSSLTLGDIEYSGRLSANAP